MTTTTRPGAWTHCPACNRSVPSRNGVYSHHLTRILRGDYCPRVGTQVA